MIRRQLSYYITRKGSLGNLYKCLYRGFAAKTENVNADQVAASHGLSYFHHIGKKPLLHRNVGQQLECSAADYSSTEAIVSYHEGKRHTFSSLLDEVDRLSAGLLKLGLKRGDRVGIYGPNNLQWYLTMLAAARASLVSVGINPAFQGPEVEYCLKKVNIKAIVAPHTFKTQNYYDILCSICPEIPTSEPGAIKSSKFPHLHAVIIGSGETKLPGALRFEDCFASGSSYDPKMLADMQNTIHPDTECNVQFTSGTTGNPKAALLSHCNFVNNGWHIGTRSCLGGERICVQVPFFHAYGVVIAIMAGLCSGATLVVPALGFDPAASLKAIVDEKCTVIYGTPTMYVDLIKKQRELKLPIRTAKAAFTGGSPCSPQLFLDIKETLHLDRVLTFFGMTETTAVIFNSFQDDTMDQVLHTVGHLQDHTEAKVVNEKGETVPFGQAGELCIRGYTTMLGYFDDEAKTKETIGPDKWLRTGDQFILRPDGYGCIVGRLKEMIIRGGENIFPKEIEDFLNTHPDILETHVIGVPDERMGEEICAFIRLHDSAKGSLTHADLKQHCKGKIAHFKVPRYVITTKDFPKTTSGKIQKFKLQKLFQESQKNS